MIKCITKLSLYLLFISSMTACIQEPFEEGNEGTKIFTGEPIPDFMVVTTDLDTISSQKAKGRTLVMVFFHTQCPDCQKELPTVEQVYSSERNDSLWQLVCIGREESMNSVIRYWSKNQFTMPVSSQEDRTIYNLFAHSRIPMLYIIDKNGIVRAVFDDRNPPDYNILKEVINKTNEENSKATDKKYDVY